MIAGWMLDMSTDDVALAAGATLMFLRARRRRLAPRCGDREEEGEEETETQPLWYQRVLDGG